MSQQDAEAVEVPVGPISECTLLAELVEARASVLTIKLLDSAHFHFAAQVLNQANLFVRMLRFAAEGCELVEKCR